MHVRWWVQPSGKDIRECWVGVCGVVWMEGK